jgi:hypothetical protein
MKRIWWNYILEIANIAALEQNIYLISEGEILQNPTKPMHELQPKVFQFSPLFREAYKNAANVVSSVTGFMCDSLRIRSLETTELVTKIMLQGLRFDSMHWVYKQCDRKQKIFVHVLMTKLC